MLVFSNRLDLARRYKQFIKENGIVDNPETVIWFLQYHKLLRENDIKIFLYQNQKIDKQDGKQ